MVIVGKIRGVFGVKGQVKVYSYTEPRENILGYVPWMLGSSSQWQTRVVESGQKHGRGIIVRLKGCDDRDKALALVGQEIAIRSDQLPEIAENEFYWSDLEGLTVITREGTELGVVSHLFETGSNDVMVVKGDRQRLIPYIWGQVVYKVDLHAGRIEVDWDAEF